jgi:preprotein translocase subunit SecF
MELREKERLFDALPAVKKVDSLIDLLPENQKDRIQAVRDIAPLVSDNDFTLDDPEAIEIEGILELLEKIKFKLRKDANWAPGKKPRDQEILTTRQALLELIGVLKHSDPKEVFRNLMTFTVAFFADFEKKFNLLKDNTHPEEILDEETLPQQLRQRFTGKSGRYLLQIYARENVWEKTHMTDFFHQLQTVDPQITGPSIVGFISIRKMKEGYIQGGFYALLAIIMVVFLTFRKPRPVFFSLVPLILTLLWTMGWMGWSGISFNLANAIALPLLLGIVVDDGIHVMHRFQETAPVGHSLLSGSTAKAISLTSWTTMIGFGSLLISKHFGIFSLGLLVAAAVGTAWAHSLIVLPALLSLTAKREE